MAAVLAFTISLAMGCPPNDPGTVVVVGGDLQPLLFNLPSGISYRVNYNTSRLALWFDLAQTMPVTANTTYQAPVVFAHGDMNANGRINGADIQLFVDVFIGTNTDPDKIMRADFDENSIIDTNDTDAFVSALLSGAAVPPTQVTFYAEGIAASAALCDTPVDVSTDPNETGSFTLAETRETTVVALTLSPSSGPIGTPVTATISPAIVPLIFDAATTAEWSGVFQPTVGSPSGTFQIQYSTAQVREQSASQAIFIIGDGSFVNAPDAAAFGGPGTMNGVLTITLTSQVIAKPFSFSPEFDAATWEQVNYPDGPGGIDAPALDGEPTNLEVMLLSNSSDPMNPTEDMLLHANGFHVAAVVRIAENAITTANAPNTFNVDLISYSSVGVQIDRIDDVVLTRVPGDDGDPAHLVYHNDLLKPIVLVDVDLNNAAYPNVIPVRVVDGGSAVIVPASN